MRTELIENFLQWKGGAWRGRPAELERALSHFERWAIAVGKEAFTEVTPADAWAYARALASEQNAKGAPRSWADQSRRLSYVSSTFSAARKRGLLAANPFRDVGVSIERPTAPDVSQSVYSQRELRDLRDASLTARWGKRRHKWAHWVLILCAYTICRPSELLGLCKGDVKVTEDGVVYLDLRTHTLKTAASRRIVPLHSDIADNFAVFAATSTSDEIFEVFPAHATVGRSAWFSAAFPRLKKSAGLNDDRSMYNLRHTGIGLLAASDVPERLQDALSGHAPRDVKSRHYLTYDLATMAAAMEHVKPFG